MVRPLAKTAGGFLALTLSRNAPRNLCGRWVKLSAWSA